MKSKIANRTAKNVQPMKGMFASKNHNIASRFFRFIWKPEFIAAFFMAGYEEILNDPGLHPAKYGLQPWQVSLPRSPTELWIRTNIGDIWEISAGFTALRLLFAGLNKVLEKVAKGKQISDEVSFWASLIVTLVIKAIHSLGYISLFHINDHMGHPVPGMLFGQGVAALVLIATHYAATYLGLIKEWVSKSFTSFLKRMVDAVKHAMNNSLRTVWSSWKPFLYRAGRQLKIFSSTKIGRLVIQIIVGAILFALLMHFRDVYLAWFYHK